MGNALVLEATLNGTYICQRDGFAYLLADEAPSMMTYAAAAAWCNALGEGYGLPSIEVLDACYQNENIRGQFDSNWYWSCTKNGKYSALILDFSNGGKYRRIDVEFSFFVRAVRKVFVIPN